MKSLNFMVVGAITSKFWLLSMNSHVIPYASDEDEAAGATNDPEPKKQFRFHTGISLSSNKRSGARASRHPPRWRAQLDIPQSGSMRRVDQWQQINPPFFIRGEREFQVGRKRKGQSSWRAGSEVKATIRWTRRAGYRSRPRFAVCLKPLTPTGNPVTTPNL